MKHWLLAVYFLVSWKEFGCDVACPAQEWSSFYTINAIGHVTQGIPGACSVKVVTQQRRFETDKDVSAFLKELNIFRGELKEEYLDHPESFKWGFKKTRVTEKRVPIR